MAEFAQDDLKWLVQEVKKVEFEILRIYQQLFLFETHPGASAAFQTPSTLWEAIATGLRDIGVDETVIRTFDQAMEDFQKGVDWAKHAIELTDHDRPFATWSIDKLCRARRRMCEVSRCVALRMEWHQLLRKSLTGTSFSNGMVTFQFPLDK